MTVMIANGQVPRHIGALARSLGRDAGAGINQVSRIHRYGLVEWLKGSRE